MPSKRFPTVLVEPSQHDVSRAQTWAKEIEARLQIHKENPEHALGKDEALSELRAVISGESP